VSVGLPCLLDLIWNALIEVLVGLLSGCRCWHPAQLLADLPDVGIHRELRTVEAKHEDASNGLVAHTFKPEQLLFDGLFRQLSKVL
jgi:hypothetical protein